MGRKPWMLAITRAGNRLVAVGERGFVLLSDDDGRSWRQARVPACVTLTAVQFVGAQQGWATGHAGLHKALLRALTSGDAAEATERMRARVTAMRAALLAGNGAPAGTAAPEPEPEEANN